MNLIELDRALRQLRLGGRRLRVPGRVCRCRRDGARTAAGCDRGCQVALDAHGRGLQVGRPERERGDGHQLRVQHAARAADEPPRSHRPARQRRAEQHGHGLTRR